MTLLSMTALLACTLALVLASLAPTAGARTRIAVGMGDQQASMFDHPAYQALRIKKVRYFIRWDAMHYPEVRRGAERYVAAARRSDARVLLHISTDDLRHKRAKLPSLARYKRSVGRLVRHFRKRGVREWGVWNEANHKSQPTWRSPRRAAQYYRAMRTLCRGCTIVGLDVLDQRGVERYIRAWYAALPRSYRSRRNIVGIHNYSDANRKRSRGTRAIIRTTRSRNRRARFWFTETGGVVNFGTAFPCNEQRAASRTAYMFRLARRYDRYVERLYPYNWTGADCNGFDAGLTRGNGQTRPAYDTFRRALGGFRR